MSQKVISIILPNSPLSVYIDFCDLIEMESPSTIKSGKITFFWLEFLAIIFQVIISPIFAIDVSISELILIDLELAIEKKIMKKKAKNRNANISLTFF